MFISKELMAQIEWVKKYPVEAAELLLDRKQEIDNLNNVLILQNQDIEYLKLKVESSYNKGHIQGRLDELEKNLGRKPKNQRTQEEIDKVINELNLN